MVNTIIPPTPDENKHQCKYNKEIIIMICGCSYSVACNTGIHSQLERPGFFNNTSASFNQHVFISYHPMLLVTLLLSEIY